LHPVLSTVLDGYLLRAGAQPDAPVAAVADPPAHPRTAHRLAQTLGPARHVMKCTVMKCAVMKSTVMTDTIRKGAVRNA